MATNTRGPRRLGIALAGGAAALILGVGGGCGGSGADVSIVSMTADASMTPELTSTAYGLVDSNTADIYLTDLPMARLLNGSDPLEDLSGNLVHVHLFMVPKAGRTPIEPAACNVSVRHLVVANGEFGIYGGGGFVLPDSKPGGSIFSADILNATTRLLSRTPGFEDRLVVGEMKGEFYAARDDRAAAALTARFSAMLNREDMISTKDIVGPPKPEPTK